MNSYLYQIAYLGDDDEEPEFSSAMPLEEGDTFLFQPRSLKNLVVVDEVDSLSPILHCQVGILFYFKVIFLLLLIGKNHDRLVFYVFVELGILCGHQEIANYRFDYGESIQL